jgi:hypothetical protein
VDKDSASMNGYPAIGLDVNHSCLVKYDSADDPNYRQLLHILQYAMNLSPETTLGRGIEH